MAATDHADSLKKLCRLCATLLTKDTFEVSKYRDRLNRAFFIDTEADCEDNHPKRLCIRCYATILNIEKRGTTTTMKIQQWKPHDLNCEVCSSIKLLQMGHRNPNRKTKKPKSGRPKKLEATWTRATSNLIIEKTPADTIPSFYTINDFKEHFNPHLVFISCNMCKNILRQPLNIIPCEHSFCLGCIIPKLEGKLISDAKCPECMIPITLDKIHPSVKLQSMLSSLKLECGKGCGELFKIDESSQKQEHEKICQISYSSETTLSDLFSLDEDSEISRNVDDAVLHVIRQKMAKSTLPNKSITFKTGGPRVSIH